MWNITKEELLYTIAEEPSVEILEQTDTTVTVYDMQEGKEITFTNGRLYLMEVERYVSEIAKLMERISKKY